MAEKLNMHFSRTVFTREDTSLLPVPETKFNRPEGNVGADSCNPRSSS